MNNSQLIDLYNPAIAITTIIAVSSFCCFKTYIDAKYNRKTIVSFGNAGLKFMSKPATNIATQRLA